MSEAGEKNSEVRTELERTLALLAFEKPQNSPFADLLEQSHRQKVASELNAAILKTQHCENTSPRIVSLLKLILWAQAELDKKNINYPKMTDLAAATIEHKNVDFIWIGDWSWIVLYLFRTIKYVKLRPFVSQRRRIDNATNKTYKRRAYVV